MNVAYTLRCSQSLLHKQRVFQVSSRLMATVRSSLPHEERTAAEPRENRIEIVKLASVREVNDSIRLFRLNALDPNHTIKFSPGQWLDTFIPGLPKAGGFTITSTPSESRPTADSPSYLELAVQKSSNPPAQWLWQEPNDILGAELAVRVGGSFVWPPPGVDVHDIDRLVLIAGGVGINPLISIFSHLVRSQTRPQGIHFLYSTKADESLDRQRILFLPRLMDLIAAADDEDITLSLFLTGIGEDGPVEHGKFPNRTFARRLKKEDLVLALDGFRQQSNVSASSRTGTVCYVCGPPKMTDEFVEFLGHQTGMTQQRVLCEKWW